MVFRNQDFTSWFSGCQDISAWKGSGVNAVGYRATGQEYLLPPCGMVFFFFSLPPCLIRDSKWTVACCRPGSSNPLNGALPNLFCFFRKGLWSNCSWWFVAT